MDGEGGSSGREYLEKIVQAGFDLPRHDQADLDKMLCEGLNRLLSFEGANRNFDAERWGKLHLLALRPILGTPRDVNRFLSSLSFTVGLFFRERTLEVNVIDMIGVEVLRVFEPDLYHQLPEKRELFLGDRRDRLAGRQDGESRRKRIEEFVGRASEPHRSGVRAILRELFPSVDWLLMGHGEGSGFEAGWMRGLRICHEALFDRYFALAVPNGDLPVSVIDRLISVIKDRDQIRRELTTLCDEGRLLDFLNRLAAYTSELDMAGAVPLATAIMDVGDWLPLRGTGMYDVWPDMAAYFIIRNIMIREVDSGTRSRMVLDALSATTGLHLPLQVVSLDRHRREWEDRFREPLLDELSWVRAKKLCLNKIKARAADGTLRGPKLGSFLGRWRELAGDGGPRKFITSLVSTLEGTLEYLRASAGEVRGQAMGNVTFTAQTRINLKAIEQFVPVARIKSKLGPLLGDDVPEGLASLAAEYQKELAAFRDALDPSRQANPDPFSHGEEAARLDLNTATLDELAKLPGIGEDLASRIIGRRPFERVDELGEVRGIGLKKLARIRRLVGI